VRVPEASRVLEAVAQQPVNGAVKKEHRARQPQEGRSEPPAADPHRHGEGCVVGEVVATGAYARPGPVASHAQVREQKGGGQRPPGVGQVGKDSQGEQGFGQSFHLQTIATTTAATPALAS